MVVPQLCSVALAVDSEVVSVSVMELPAGR